MRQKISQGKEPSIEKGRNKHHKRKKKEKTQHRGKEIKRQPKGKAKEENKEKTNEKAMPCIKANVCSCLFSYRVVALHFSNSEAKLKG